MRMTRENVGRQMYLKGTPYLKIHMKADSLSIIRWWVDASYGVHWDSKGHTGAMMSRERVHL